MLISHKHLGGYSKMEVKSLIVHSFFPLNGNHTAIVLQTFKATILYLQPLPVQSQLHPLIQDPKHRPIQEHQRKYLQLQR